MLRLILSATLMPGLAAGGTGSGTRALSGGLIGAGADAGAGSWLGGSPGTGAIVGDAVRAVGGAVTAPGS